MAKNNTAGIRRRMLERLTGSKGSVLFFVIAIMSMLIVLASALYYAVTSANKEVQVKYANEQAYQSAISINNMVSDYIAADPDAKFVDAAFALTKGDSIKTTVSDLGAGIGSIKVTITKISGDADSAILSITTESEVNGQLQTVTSVGELKAGQDDDQPASMTRFFTSTGYVPNDTLFDSGEITSELYLDSEYTEIGSAGNKASCDADIISAGTVRFVGSVEINKSGGAGSKKLDFTIGNDLYLYGPMAKFDLGGGTLRVGGSVIQLANRYAFSHTNVYIQGDYYSGTNMNESGGAPNLATATQPRLFVNGNMVIADSFGYDGEIFVNGDLFIDKDYNQGKFAAHLVVGGNVYIKKDTPEWQSSNWFNGADISGKIIYSEADIDFDLSPDYTVYEAQDVIENVILANSAQNGGVGGYTYIWPSGSDDADPCDAMETVTAIINDTIGTSNYINWDLDKQFRVDKDPSKDYIATTPVVFSSTQRTAVLSAENTDRYIIQDIDVKGGGASALMFDTSDGKGGYKDIYVLLKPNAIYNKGASGNGKVTYPEHSFIKHDFVCPGVLPDGTACDGTVDDYIGYRNDGDKYLECDNCHATYPCPTVREEQNGKTWNQWMGTPAPYDLSFKCTNCSESISQFTMRFVKHDIVTNHFECTKCGYVAEESQDPWLDGIVSGEDLVTKNIPMFQPNYEPVITTPESELNAFMFGDTVPNAPTLYGAAGTSPNNGDPFHVFVKGKGSVIFVLPEGETFVARKQSYMGHYALFKEIIGQSVETVPDSGWSWVGEGSMAKPLKEYESDTTKFSAADGLYSQAMIDKYGETGEKLYLHNNVFLVSVEKNVNIDLDQDELVFAGMIYAPYMQYTSTSNASGRVIFGGLVVSNYDIRGTAKYIYAAPYDYYDTYVKDADALTDEQREEERNKYLVHLMGSTGSSGYLEDGGKKLGRAWNRFGYN